MGRKVKRYNVQFEKTVEGTIIVSARDMDDAREQAEGLLHRINWDPDSVDIRATQIIEEEEG